MTKPRCGLPNPCLYLTTFSWPKKQHRRKRFCLHLLEEALKPQGPMEATLHLLQPLLEDIQNLLGGRVLLQSQSLPRLGQVLLGKGGSAQTQAARPVSLLCLLGVSLLPSHLNLRVESPKSQLCLLQSREGVTGHSKTGQLLLSWAREPLQHLRHTGGRGGREGKAETQCQLPPCSTDT